MPIARFQLEDGRVARFEVPEGTTPEQAQAMMQSHFASQEPASVKAGKEVNSIPRQLGLTARYGLEGLAGTAEIVTEPIRYLTDRLTGSTGKTKPAGALASDFADYLGLPKPQGADERVVGEAVKMGFGAAGLAGLSGAPVQIGKRVFSTISDGPSVVDAFAKAPNVLQRFVNAAKESPAFLNGNVAQQLSAATGAGLAGGASKEAGGSELQQGIAAFGGGVAGGLVPSLAGGVANVVKSQANRVLMSNADFDLKLGQVLRQTGVDYNKVPERLRQSLREELSSALRAGQELDPAAVSRLLAFKEAGITPTRGMVSQNPVQITREMNLAKMGANSSDEGLQGLAQIQNQNNTKLIENLNTLGAGKGDAYGSGQRIIAAITGKDSAKQSNVSSLYDAARNTAGGDIPLDRKAVIDNIFGALAKENKLAYLPSDIAETLNTISQGSITKNGQTFGVPFNAKTLDNLLTDIATAQRSTQDGNVKRALAVARQAIDNTSISPVKQQFGGNQLVTEQGAAFLRDSDAQAGNFMDALNKARAAHAERMKWQESARPIEAAVSGAQPDNFIKTFVLGGTVDDVAAIVKNGGQEAAKVEVLAHLKDRALNGAADEVGKFSQSAFNRALNGIGDRKLSLLFSPEEIQALRINGRVAALMQSQPVGSAVNNSNSGALLLGRGYDAFRGLAGKLPFGQQLVLDPLQNISLSINTQRARNVVPGLLAEQPKGSLTQPYLLPALAAGGLLAP